MCNSAYVGRVVWVCLTLCMAGCSTRASIQGTYDHFYAYNDDGMTSITLRELKNFQKSPNLLYPDEQRSFVITLNNVFLRYLQAVDGEILVYSEANVLTDDVSKTKLEPVSRILYYKEGQGHNADIGFVDGIVYGPAEVPKYPLRIRLVVVELDKEDNENLRNMLGAAVQTGQSLYPEAAPVLAVAEAVGQYVIANNADDFEIDMTYTFYPGKQTPVVDASNAKKYVNLPLAEGTIVTVKTESPKRRIPPETIVADGLTNAITNPNWLLPGPVWMIGQALPSKESIAESWSLTQSLELSGGRLKYVAEPESNATGWKINMRHNIPLTLLLYPLRLIALPGETLFGDRSIKDKKREYFRGKTYLTMSIKECDYALPNDVLEKIYDLSGVFIHQKLIDPSATQDDALTALKDLKALVVVQSRSDNEIQAVIQKSDPVFTREGTAGTLEEVNERIKQSAKIFVDAESSVTSKTLNLDISELDDKKISNQVNILKMRIKNVASIFYKNRAGFFVDWKTIEAMASDAAKAPFKWDENKKSYVNR